MYKNRSVDDGQRTVTKKTKMKQQWFDAECIVMKRELIQSERRYVKKPDNTVLRSEYYPKIKEYRKHIKCKKFKYSQKLGESIHHNNNLPWENVKKTKV